MDNKLVQHIVQELVPTPYQDPFTGELFSTTETNFQSIIADTTSIVLTIDNFTGAPGSTVTVPIKISDAEAVQSVQISLVYDTRILNLPDPDSSTLENEGVRRAGISANWILNLGEGNNPNQEAINPVANVNENTGEVIITLSNPGDTPQAGSSGTILEIDFQVSADASGTSVGDIDLQTAKIGVNNEELLFADSNFSDGSITVSNRDLFNTIDLFRFRNTAFSTGTYLFTGAGERDAILANPDFNQTFALEGDGNAAFTASAESEDSLLPFFRLKSLDVPGTFLFVGTSEYNAIFAANSDQKNKWEKEGLDGQGTDIPEFYLFGVGAGQGLEFHRFQNTQNGTFLYAGPSETQSINSNPNFTAVFIDQGIAFESVV